MISNGTHTKYYSNTTRESHIKELGEVGRKKSKKTSNSFEFTSYWADAKNQVIPDLVDFTKTFFSKHTILNILTRYCVFDTDNKLLVMRPYQIVATEKIINRIETSSNYKKLGKASAGGYIWHTTGSGKTLTSFKTAQLVAKMPHIDKVLFVVDRKDLDYQTMKEYDRFEKGAADGNTSTRILQRQLESNSSRIIVTTIQKLGVFIRKNPKHDVYSKHIVIIFDECHRSQFGDMHSAIIKAFKNYHLFGFTGTPIFAQNANSGGNPTIKTTGQAFGDKLHTYTIVDAINDKNVLPFRIDYINTIKEKSYISDKQINNIDREHALLSDERVSMITSYILEHFDQKTKRNQFYNFNRTANVTDVVKFGDSKRETLLGRMNGFNSIFAVASIPAAKKYYTEFKKQLAKRNSSLKVAAIFSFAANEDDSEDGYIFDEDFNVIGMEESSREFLESVITDYNKDFNTNYDTSSDSFQNYYKDLSLRVKNREIDLLIVVNMFLTGFDATTLNTLWVDKELKMHGLIQAFSRTNRILNSVKQFGNIICFRNLAEKVDEAIGLFGDRDASGIVLLKSYNEYLNGYDKNGEHKVGYIDLISELFEKFPLGERITGEQNQKDFIKLFGKILRMRNILTSFDKFMEDDKLKPRDLQNYQSKYLDIYHTMRPTKPEKENINDDIVFEIELIRQTEVNVDYILALVAKYHASNCRDKDILTNIDRAMDASLSLRSKKELIHSFIQSYSPKRNDEIHDAWRHFIINERDNELNKIIEDNKLNSTATKRLVENSFRDGTLKTTGTDIDHIMPPISRFGDNNRSKKKKGVIERLLNFFEKYFGAI